MLLAAHWLYKILNGGSVPKTTLNTLKIETRSLQKEYRNRKDQEQADRKALAAAQKALKRDKKAMSLMRILQLKPVRKFIKKARII